MMNFKKHLVLAMFGFLGWTGVAGAVEKNTDPRSLGIGIFQYSPPFSTVLILLKTSAKQRDANFDDEHGYRFFWIDAKDLSDIVKSIQQPDGKWGKCPDFNAQWAAIAFRVRRSMAEGDGEFCIPAKDAGALFGEMDRASASSTNKEFRSWLGTMIESLRRFTNGVDVTEIPAIPSWNLLRQEKRQFSIYYDLA